MEWGGEVGQGREFLLVGLGGAVCVLDLPGGEVFGGARRMPGRVLLILVVFAGAGE